MFETLRALVSPRQAKLYRAFGLMEHFYFIANPDVASAVSRGEISSGLEHWITYGAREGRSYGGFSSAENAALLTADVQTLKQQLNEYQERFNQLEALLTEHPAVASRGGVRNTT